jgi:hypothetical protein
VWAEGCTAYGKGGGNTAQALGPRLIDELEALAGATSWLSRCAASHRAKRRQGTHHTSSRPRNDECERRRTFPWATVTDGLNPLTTGLEKKALSGPLFLLVCRRQACQAITALADSLGTGLAPQAGRLGRLLVGLLPGRVW